MKIYIVTIILIVCLSGCKTTDKMTRILRNDVKPVFVPLERFEFGQTPDPRFMMKDGSTDFVTARFDGLPLKTALNFLASQSGVTIICSQGIDNHEIYGVYEQMPLNDVLRSIAARANVQLSYSGGVFFLGDIRQEDKVTVVCRNLPTDEFVSNISDIYGGELKAVSVGSCLWLSGSFYLIEKAIADIERLRERLSRVYVAEVFFVRVREEDFLKFAADLNIKAIDVLGSSFAMSQMFEMIVSGDAGLGRVAIDQRPVLYLSESRESTFSIGSDLTLEKKAVSKDGIIETTGYQQFSDGLDLKLKLSRVSEYLYSINFDLSVSTFDDKTDSSSLIPRLDKNVLTSPGMLISDNSVYYVGSVTRKSRGRSFGIFTINNNYIDEFVTVWLRVRELKHNVR